MQLHIDLKVQLALTATQLHSERKVQLALTATRLHIELEVQFALTVTRLHVELKVQLALTVTRLHNELRVQLALTVTGNSLRTCSWRWQQGLWRRSHRDCGLRKEARARLRRAQCAFSSSSQWCAQRALCTNIIIIVIIINIISVITDVVVVIIVARHGTSTVSRTN